MKKVIFFYDYNENSGFGHFQRCNKIKKIFPKNFLFFKVSKNFKKFLKKNIEIFDYGIIDSYFINFTLEKKIKKICKKLITIDDLANRSYASDIIINYSPSIKKENYINKINKNTKLFVGSRYNFINDNCKINKLIFKKKLNIFCYLGQKNRNSIINYMINKIKNKNIINKIYIFNNKNKVKNETFLKKMDISDILIISSGVTLNEALSKKKLIFCKYFSLNQKKNFIFYEKKKLIYKFSYFEKFINLPLKEINLKIINQKKKTIFNLEKNGKKNIKKIILN